MADNQEPTDVNSKAAPHNFPSNASHSGENSPNTVAARQDGASVHEAAADGSHRDIKQQDAGHTGSIEESKRRPEGELVGACQQQARIPTEEMPLVFHSHGCRHTLNIIGPPRHHKLDNSRSLMVQHEEKTKHQMLKYLKTTVQVLPAVTQKDGQRETRLLLTLTLGRPRHPEYVYSSDVQAILWDDQSLKELGKIQQDNQFAAGNDQMTLDITLADREKVERSKSKTLKMIIRVTIRGNRRDQRLQLSDSYRYSDGSDESDGYQCAEDRNFDGIVISKKEQ